MDTKLKKYIEKKRNGNYEDLKLIYQFSLFNTYSSYEDCVILNPDIIKKSSWFEYLKMDHYAKIINGGFCYIDCPFCLRDWKIRNDNR